MAHRAVGLRFRGAVLHSEVQRGCRLFFIDFPSYSFDLGLVESSQKFDMETQIMVRWLSSKSVVKSSEISAGPWSIRKSLSSEEGILRNSEESVCPIQISSEAPNSVPWPP